MTISINLFAVSLGACFLLGALIAWIILNTRYNSFQNENIVRINTLQKENEMQREKILWLEKTEQRQRDTFDSIAAKALRENSQLFLSQSNAQLKSLRELMQGDWTMQRQELKNLVGPIEQELGTLDKNVRILEQKREGAYRTLETHIVNLSRAQNELQNATSTLSQALKSSSVRGRWGEVQLRRIAEMAGMAEHVDFDEQKSTDSGSGRPDMTIYLPEKGIIPVDAKAPMSAYLSSHESDRDEDKNRYMVEHVKSLRNHVRSLASRAYWSQFNKSPQFVVMLIPYESGLSDAFSQDPELLEFALDNRVIIVSPATLLALLKVIAMGWMQIQITENAEKIAESGKELYNRFSVFNRHMSDIGKKLNDSVVSYNKAVGSMETRVLPSARRLKELGAGTEEITDALPIDNMSRIPEVIE